VSRSSTARSPCIFSTPSGSNPKPTNDLVETTRGSQTVPGPSNSHTDITACAYFAGSINSSVEVETIGSNHRRTWRDLSPSARFSSNITYLQSLRCVEVTIIGAYAGALLRLLESATPPNRIDWEGWDIPFGHVHDLDLEI
jgi:hypothetical protein